ncbi:MAG: Rrf2 family transcriptional regulator [Acidobacteria bacterium]|nr:Rrf2 family transcriptional regulator [Acidobacteriota bacterium]
MFSQTAEYALRAVVCLADAAPAARTSQQIAELTQAPRDYLSKILQALGRADLVAAQRGKRGGFSLTRAAEEITLYDVLEAVDPIPRIRRCPLGLRAHRTQLCPLHRRLDSAMESVERELRGATIAEMMRPDAGVRPLCEIVEAAHA